jgi:hypothetical protein
MPYRFLIATSDSARTKLETFTSFVLHLLFFSNLFVPRALAIRPMIALHRRPDTHSTDTNGNPSIFTVLITPIRPAWSTRSLISVVLRKSAGVETRVSLRSKPASSRSSNRWQWIRSSCSLARRSLVHISPMLRPHLSFPFSQGPIISHNRGEVQPNRNTP